MIEITNNIRKAFASLDSVKGRRQLGMFMAQGTKTVTDTLGHFRLEALLATDRWIEQHPEIVSAYEVIPQRESDIQRVSSLTTPQGVIAVYHIPHVTAPDINGTLALALDGVQDPGNLGTIMRVADWMGVRHIIASTDTVDVWSPKVVQATMGAISRVSVYYTELTEYISGLSGVDVYGTFLDGDDIYTTSLSNSGLIVMGNEGRGIRPATEALVTRRLFIPPYPVGCETSESLNVAIATAITLSEFRHPRGVATLLSPKKS